MPGTWKTDFWTLVFLLRLDVVSTESRLPPNVFLYNYLYAYSFSFVTI
jgi:hypothetical protein